MIDATYENSVLLIGKVISSAQLYQKMETAYYELVLRVNRATRGKYDDVHILAPEWAIGNIRVGMNVKVRGELRCYKNYDSDWQLKRHMVYTTRIIEVPDAIDHVNKVSIKGELLNVHDVRVTKYSERHISDFLVLVPRTSGYAEDTEKADPIYCIAWGEQAHMINSIPAGTHVIIDGRAQSRTFNKKCDDGTITKGTVIEVSCYKIQIAED